MRKCKHFLYLFSFIIQYLVQQCLSKAIKFIYLQSLVIYNKLTMESYKNVPTRKYKFTQAKPKRFVTNYFFLQLKQDKTMVYHYNVKFEPPIQQDSTKKMQRIINTVSNQLKQKIGMISSRGNSIYGTKNENSSIIIKSHMIIQSEQTTYQLLIRKTNDLPLKDMLYSHRDNQKFTAIQVINVNTKQRLKALNMVDLGKGKFYQKKKIVDSIFDNGFFIMKGYKFTTCSLNMGLCLQVDIFSRLIRQANLLEQINSFKSKDQAVNELEGSIVIARYGNFRTYEILKIQYDKSPLTKFIPHNRQQEITYQQYYKQQYDMQIKSTMQPLILSASKIQKLKNKQQKMQTIYHYVYLIPELLSLVGLSNSQRNNMDLMKKIAEKTKYTPNNRMNIIKEKANQLNQIQGFFDIQDPVKMNGFQLAPPTIQMRSTIQPHNGSFNMKQSNIKEYHQLKDWFLFYHHEYQSEAQNLKNSLLFAGGGIGMKLNQPIQLDQDKLKAEDWISQIQQQLQYNKQKGYQMPLIIVIVVGGIITDEVYNQVKSLCTLKLEIPSQFVHAKKIKSLMNRNNLLSYATNLLLQMSVKIGKTIWTVPTRNQEIKQRRVMVGGMSISKVNKKHSLGFVGTISMDFTKVYNEAKAGIARGEIGSKLEDVFANWLKAFYIHNKKGKLPELIIFYREGISRTQLTGSSEDQIKALKKMIQTGRKKTSEVNYNPQIVYITVNKQSTSRFYQIQNNKYCNPRPGSVIIEEMSSTKFFDFHLAPHCVEDNITSNPSHFIICHHQPKRTSQQAIIELTYEQCYNYYNWKGSIKFPACLQNADRLAKMTNKTLKSDIGFQSKMSRSYHFL